MSDDDMISKTAALEAVAGWEIPSTAIAALPAVTVGVPEATVHRAVQDWIRDDAGAAVKMSMTPDRANALTARILAALDLTPAPDAPAEDAIAKGETCGQMLDRLGADGAKWAAEFRTTALRLGYSDMDEGWLIGWFCNAIMAGHDRQPAPDAAAIREAALREALREVGNLGAEFQAGGSPTAVKVLNLASDRITALLPKGGA